MEIISQFSQGLISHTENSSVLKKEGKLRKKTFCDKAPKRHVYRNTLNYCVMDHSFEKYVLEYVT